MLVRIFENTIQKVISFHIKNFNDTINIYVMLISNTIHNASKSKNTSIYVLSQIVYNPNF